MSNVVNKTIFITSFQGLVSRVLESGVLEHLLKDKDVRVVVFAPDFKADYFMDILGKYKQVTVVGVSRSILPPQARFFHQLSFLLLYTKTMRLKRRSARDFRSWPRFILHEGTASLLGRWRIVRWIFRLANQYLSGTPVLDEYFEKYHPDLVLAMDVKDMFDTQFVLEAKLRGIKTVGMVRSWDYLTAKGVIRSKPDKMIVHNQIIKGEAVKYADMRPDDIAVTGIPHYDLYVNSPCAGRKELFKRINVPQDKRLILLGSVGKKFGATDDQIFEIIDKAIHNGGLPMDLVVLVRLPPSDTLSKEAKYCREHFVFEYPGISFPGHARKENEMSLDDLLHLADLLYHSEAVITGPSTICIDASVFDKPMVLLGFEGYKKRPYFQSIIHRYDFDHMRHFMKWNASKLAQSADELIFYINEAIQNPYEQKSGRASVVKEQCGRLDGHSSGRFADVILTQVK